jgi:hypothetical protein
MMTQQNMETQLPCSNAATFQNQLDQAHLAEDPEKRGLFLLSPVFPCLNSQDPGKCASQESRGDESALQINPGTSDHFLRETEREQMATKNRNIQASPLN